MYRNPNQAAEQAPNNRRAPLYVDLSLDLAMFATDAKGNAVLAQTVLGVQATGTVIATQGVLAIETVAALDLGLLGVTSAPLNMVLELITSPGDSPPSDTQGPSLVATYPAAMSTELPVDAGIELVFDEPARPRSGCAPAACGSRRRRRRRGALGAREPRLRRSWSGRSRRSRTPRIYRVMLSDVADASGNLLASTTMVAVRGAGARRDDRPGDGDLGAAPAPRAR